MFNELDLAIIVLVVLAACVGLIMGLVKAVFSLALWATALVLSVVLAPWVAGFLEPVMENPTWSYVTAFACVFVATLVVGAVLQWLMGQLIHSTGLTATDRVFGMVFGGALGVVVCIVALIALQPLVADQAWWQASVLVPKLMAFEDQILGFLGRTTDLASELVR
jgi:membrane protein required for colicin V production